MTTYAERGLIQRDARLDPFGAGFVSPTDSTTPAVSAAVNFLRRLRSAMEDIAYDIVTAAITTPPMVGTSASEQLIWANKVSNGEVDPSFAAMRLVLAEFDEVAPPDLAAVTDGQMKVFLETVVPILARDIRK